MSSNRSLKMSAAEAARAERRFDVRLSALIRTGLLSMPVRIRDLSRSGAQVEAPCPPPTGGTITLTRENFAVEARVMWVDGPRCGIRFDRTIRATDLLILLNKSRVAAEPIEGLALSA